jgi:outer membrane biosynthesis protein TonB
VVISAAGKVQSTRVIGGHPLLINAAVEAVRKWKYEPASAPTTTIVTIVFDDSALRGR